MMMRHGIASLADADDVEVDWDNPLTRGLTHLYIRPGVDLTSGERTAGSAPANAATRWGRALQASRSLLPYADSAANTIIGHLRMTAYDNFVGLGIGYYVSDSDMFAFQIGNWNDGELKTIIRSSGSPTGFYTLTTPSFPYDVVVALAGTIGNGNTQTPYINGVAQTGQAFTGSYFADSRKNFSLGSGANYSSSFGMRFARVLAAHEIQALSREPHEILRPRRIWVPASAGGGAQTSTLTEPTTSTDALAALYAAVASQSEAAAVADDLAAALTSPAALTEAAAAADATTAVVTLLAVLTEAASLADALAALLVAVADVAEPATAVELLSTGAQYAGTLLEEITATDTMAAAATLVALLTEPATAADAAAGSYPATYTCSVAELASVLEQMVAVLGTEVFTASARTRIGPATLMDAAERIGSRTTVPGLASRVGGKSI